MNNIQFIQKITENIPWIKIIYLKHVAYYDEILPHILMEEISEVFIETGNEAFISGINTEGKITELSDFLKLMEEEMNTGSTEICELISLSFLENINPQLKIFSSIQQLMGKSLKLELDRLLSYRNTQ
jgi:hypothetical protein